MSEQKQKTKSELKQVKEIELARLMFDQNNPRFGAEVGKIKDQTEILDLIVNEYGVDDVLSSLAVNGYFSAEPIIVREIPDSKYLTVVEGNRRLAACLILAEDERAKNQKTRSLNIKKAIKAPIPTKIPVILFHLHENEKEIISYLGVRHIAAAQPWDSYAKAAWVARVIDQNGFSLEDVTTMVGEKTGTISRMLEGYYLITQLIESSRFNPENSFRKGRGSNSKYPFSWVYTFLGYPVAKKFLELPDTPTKNPIPADKLDDAVLIIESLFGNSSKGKSPVIEDSRKIGNFASLLSDPQKVVYIRRGEKVEDIEKRFTPLSTQLSDGLTECIERLSMITSTLAQSPPLQHDAEKYIQLVYKVRMLAKDINDKLKASSTFDDTDL